MLLEKRTEGVKQTNHETTRSSLPRALEFDIRRRDTYMDTRTVYGDETREAREMADEGLTG